MTCQARATANCVEKLRDIKIVMKFWNADLSKPSPENQVCEEPYLRDGILLNSRHHAKIEFFYRISPFHPAE